MKPNKIAFSKVSELSLINLLISHDTYFADTFDTQTVNQIQNNINNDFPLLLNTDFIRLSKQERELIKSGLKMLHEYAVNLNQGAYMLQIEMILKKL